MRHDLKTQHVIEGWCYPSRRNSALGYKSPITFERWAKKPIEVCYRLTVHETGGTPIIGVLKESEAGAKTDDICRRHGISSATFYSGRKKYGGMEAGDAKRLRALEAENAKLKRIVVDRMLDMSAMKDLLQKHW